MKLDAKQEPKTRKVLFVGDIHGRSDWITYVEEAVMRESTDAVFIGDYVDSFDHNGREIEQNLHRIISFKKKIDKRHIKPRQDRIGRVYLLLGNHDYAYMLGKTATSGYNHNWAQTYHRIFEENWDLFDLAWGHEDEEGNYTLATHAGITYDWWKNYVLNEKYDEHKFAKEILGEDWEKSYMHEVLNVLKDKMGFLWKIGYERGGSGTPGPLWADFKELKADPYPGINQIVGHTGWHTPETFFTEDGKFLMKIDGWGKEVRRMILNF